MEKEAASMIRRSTLVICVAAIVLLAAGIAALSLWPEPQPEPPPPSPSSPGTAELIRESLDDVISISFYPLGGTPFTLSRDPADAVIGLDAPGALFPGKPSIMRTTYSYATSLPFLTRVAENADDSQLALFGFDAPVMTWRVFRADGTSVELAVGAELVTGRGRYVRRQDSRGVFALNDLQSTYLTQTLEDIYDLSFFPSGSGVVEWNSIDHLLLESNGNILELHRRSDAEMAESPLGTSLYHITQPFAGECNEYLTQTLLLEHIAGIAPGSVVTAYPYDLSIYGLDDPDRLTVTIGDWSGTLLIGRRDAGQNGRYVMLEGHDAVLFDPNGRYAFLEADPAQFRMATIWLHNITGVSSVTFGLEGVTRVLRLEHTGENQLRGRLDDTELSETNARRLYMAALRISQNGSTDAAVPNEWPAYDITIRFLDGGTETLELYRLNDSQFLIVHDGVNTGLFINRMTLRQGFLSRFDMLDRGEDLPQL
jgi:hypothetical protein